MLCASTGCAVNDWLLSKDPLGTKARGYEEWENSISAPPIGISELPGKTRSSKIHIEGWTDHRADVTLSLDDNFLSAKKCGSGFLTMKVCTNTKLSDGRHTFRAQARWCFKPHKAYKLALGKTEPVCRSSSASRTVVVDTTPPDVSVQLEPDGENLVVEVGAVDRYSTVAKVVVNRQVKDHNGRFVVPYHEIPPEGISIVAEDELGNRSDPKRIPLADIPLPDEYWVEVDSAGDTHKIVAKDGWEPKPGILGFGATSWDHIIDDRTVGGYYTPGVWYLLLASMAVAIPTSGVIVGHTLLGKILATRKRRRKLERQRAEAERRRQLEQKHRKLCEQIAKAKIQAAVKALGSTYYEVLDISRTANGDEVKKAYRRLARRYHPDVNGKPEGEACFKRVNEAHEVLSDPEKRAKYDQRLDLLARAEKFRRGKT